MNQILRLLFFVPLLVSGCFLNAQSVADNLKVLNWNIEWFGSPSNGPTNDALQQTNVSTVLKNTVSS